MEWMTRERVEMDWMTRGWRWSVLLEGGDGVYD